MALSIDTKNLIESFNPYFHMYHQPLGQDYDNHRYADHEVIKNELGCLKFDVTKFLDVSGDEVTDFTIDRVHQAFKIALRDGNYTYGDQLKNALHLWLGEKMALRPNSKVFAM